MNLKGTHARSNVDNARQIKRAKLLFQQMHTESKREVEHSVSVFNQQVLIPVGTICSRWFAGRENAKNSLFFYRSRWNRRESPSQIFDCCFCLRFKLARLRLCDASEAHGIARFHL